MRRENLVGAVERILDRAGWQHAQHEEGCFDLFASDEGEHALLLKVAVNVDGPDRPDTEEMKRASQFLGASPLVVGTRTSRRELRPQVIYERYGIPTIRPDTLDAYLRLRERTGIMNKRGGYYVSLDPEKLEERREEEGYSLNALAKEVGVSRKTIQNYRRRGVAQYEKAQRLEEVLGNVAASIDILETEVAAEPETDHPVAKRLIRIGFEASGFERAPFDAAARDEEDRYVAKQDRAISDALVTFLRDVTALSDSTPFVVTETREAYDGLATIREEDLDRVRDKDDLEDELR